ncbi:hypothetical protein [Antrihabitans cavernicola]|uniref:hypothetical protein n=1 Tax=Antrihabitans cavernicola TaxID=2495913 RepID=UPI0016593891|nr:hypothetical protein [Spelaeibacter cavernicola]
MEPGIVELQSMQHGIDTLLSRARDFLNGREIGPDEYMLRSQRAQTEQVVAGVRRLALANFHDFAGQFQPPSVHTEELFADRSHEELKERVDRIDPEKVAALKDTWIAISKRADEHLAAFRPRILNAIQAKWEGDAAAVAAKGITDYVEQSHQLTQATGLLAAKVQALNYGLMTTKDNVPDVPQFSLLDKVISFAPGPTWHKMQRERDAAHAETVRVLQTIYAPAVRDSDTGVPILPPPHNPIRRASAGTSAPYAQPTVGVGSAPRSEPDGTFFDRWIGSYGGDAPGSEDIGTERKPNDVEAAAFRDPRRTTAQQLESGRATTSPASMLDNGRGSESSTIPTNAAQSSDPVIGTNGAHPAATNSVGTTAGGTDSTGFKTTGQPSTHPSAYLPTPSPLSQSQNQPRSYNSGNTRPTRDSYADPSGRSLEGLPTSSSMPRTEPSGTSRPGAPGAGGMGGMFPPGGRGKGDEDGEHKTPSYLITLENGNNLIGDLPKVAPPVIEG